MVSSLTRKLPTIVGAMLLVATLFTAYTATMAQADHMPADKVAAAGSTVDQLDDETLLLQETMRVSSPSDLILSVTAECAILTALDTEGSDTADDEETDTTEGTVEIWVEVDGTPVPVASGDLDGRVVFCNRAYERTVEDVENSDDGFDSERDFIRTRAANAFNWLAINPAAYDEGGDNILNIEVWASYTDTTPGLGRCDQTTGDAAFETCSEAFVGQRTLIVEPTKLSIHEQVTTTEGDTGRGNPNKP